MIQSMITVSYRDYFGHVSRMCKIEFVLYAF